MSRAGGLHRRPAAPTAPATAGVGFPRLVDAGGARRPEAGTELITVDRVGKTYSPRRDIEVAAVAEVSLRLVLGRSYLVRGASGSGKTTLLSLIGCMTRPTEGRIRVAGREVTRLPEDELAELRRRVFGFVFQRHHLIARLSVIGNVMLPGVPRADSNDFDRRARDLLTALGLGDRLHTAVRRLSGGEQQRVAIARALVNDPLVVIADEPTAHLDSRATDEFLALADDLRRRGRLVVVASHDPVVCDAPCFDEVVEVRDGRVREAGE